MSFIVRMCIDFSASDPGNENRRSVFATGEAINSYKKADEKDTDVLTIEHHLFSHT